MLNSPIRIKSVAGTMPSVEIKVEGGEMEPYATTHYMSLGDYKVEDYEEPYETKPNVREDLKEESPDDGIYDECNGHLSSYKDDSEQFCSDDDSSRDSSEDGEAEFEPRWNNRQHSALHDTDSDSTSESSSSGSSSSSSSTENMDDPEEDIPAVTQLMCDKCGKGPFKNLKVHLHHCSSMARPFQCSVCKKSFRNEKAQLKHKARYHVCFLCSEVFVHWSLYRSHVCPKGPKPLSPTIFWSCSTTPPNKCNICKAFFATKNSLLSHLVSVHSTKVTSKVCIITNPALVTPINTASAASGSGLALLSSGVASSQDLRGLAPVMNGHCFKSQVTSQEFLNGHVANAVTGFQTHPHKSKPKPQTPAPSEHRVNTRSRTAAAAATTTGTTSASSRLAAGTGTTSRPTQSSWTAAVVVCKSKRMAEHPGIVLRISKTKFRKPAKNASRLSKASYHCRQCGVVSRQPSFAISHRYRHRGRRLHSCQCGRTFLHRLHLLRHCVQHAEATSYICAKCGEAFRGAKLLVEHLTGQSSKPQGDSWTLKSRNKCIKKDPFCCECGLCFDRPSAYIWHQLQNMQKPKVHRKRLK